MTKPLFPSPRQRLSSFSAAGLLVALLLCAAPAAAAGAPRQPLSTGFSDDFVFQAPTASTRTTWFERAETLGSTWVRLSVYWRLIAPGRRPKGFRASDPSDPHYRWQGLDAVVRNAVAHNQQVVLMIYQGPRWAYSPHPPRSALIYHDWRPRVSALGAFAHAVAERYDGHFPDPAYPGRNLPRVSYFQAWNEPNLPVQITPQWTRTRSGIVPASPAIYRTMLNAVYANVKAAQPAATVLAAGTGPYGDPPGGYRVPPVIFWRELLCLHGSSLRRERCPHPAHFDAWDHHPYAATPSIPASSPNDVSVPDLWRIKRVIAAAQRDRTLLPRGPKPIWMTELDWSSRPPDPYGIPLYRQAEFVELAFFRLWRQGVTHVMWYLMRDIPYKSSAGSGLYFRNGRIKPSATAFRFPFVAAAAGRGRLVIWGRSPTPGHVTIQRSSGHGWRNALTVSTNSSGVFEVTTRIRSRYLRAATGAFRSLSWSLAWGVRV